MGRLNELDINKNVTLDNLRDMVMSIKESLDCELGDIARHMGVEPGTLYSWLHGRNMPDIEDLAYLCAMGGVGIDDIIVRNYEVDHPTLEKQRECLEQLESKIEKKHRKSKLEEDEVDYSIQSTIILNEQEKNNSPVVTLNEAMMYISIMDDEAFHCLQNRLQFVGNTDRDKRYIWSLFKFVVNDVMPDDAVKEYQRKEIDLCTHNPYWKRAQDDSMNFKQEIIENYLSSLRDDWALGESCCIRKYDNNHIMQCLMDTFENVWSYYPKYSFVEFMRMIMPGATEGWDFEDCDLLNALVEFEDKINSDEGDEE